MNLKKIMMLLMLSPGAIFCAGQEETDRTIRKANELYKKQDYVQAEKEYQKVATDPRARYNLGNTLYKQDKKQDALSVYADLSSSGNELEMRAQSYYNTGVVLSSQKKLEESIEAYKNALRINPDDQWARENLQKAILELRKKNPPKNEEKKKNPTKKQPPQPKLNQRQAEQKLKQLQQKEKETQQKLQQKQPVGVVPRDW